MANRRSNGGNSSPESVSSLVDIMQTPAANTFLVSQRLALEAAKFWARRMRAYADQMEELAGCRSADDVAGAQTRFLERLREDYAAESEAIGELLSSATPPNGESRRSPEA
jgi:hypothetical protein